jgi:hypothetical protein
MRSFITFALILISQNLWAGTLSPLSEESYRLLQSAEGSYEAKIEGWAGGSLSLIDLGKRQFALTLTFVTKQGIVSNLSLPWVRYDEKQQFFEAFDFGGDYPGHWKWDELTQYLRFRLRKTASGGWEVTATLLSQQQHVSISGERTGRLPSHDAFPAAKAETDITGKYFGTNTEGLAMTLLVTKLEGHYIASLSIPRQQNLMRFCNGIPGPLPESVYLTTCRPSTPAQVFVQLRGNFVGDSFTGAYVTSSSARWREVHLTREPLRPLAF